MKAIVCWEDFIGSWTPAELKDKLYEDNLDRDEDNQYDIRRFLAKIVDNTLGRAIGGHWDYWWTDRAYVDLVRMRYRDTSTEGIVDCLMELI